MTIPVQQDDSVYRETLLAPVRLCLDYTPKLGANEDVDLPAFRILYGSDPLYHWMGFDSDLMYAAHKAAGGMTSLYRQLGIGCERLFRQILRDSLGLTAAQTTWSYQKAQGTKLRTLTLDGRISVADIPDPAAAKRVADWIELQKKALNLSVTLTGAVFEVRQGYKSADSKRQNADLDNASQALGDGYLPVLSVISSQVNQVVRIRYEAGKWAVLTGLLGLNNPLVSTFDFLHDVVGYDFEGFFRRNHEYLRAETENILIRLLAAS